MLSVIYIILSGIVSLLFGISVLKLKEFETPFKSISIFYIIMGAVSMTLILVIIQPVISIVLRILEARYFIKAAKK